MNSHSKIHTCKSSFSDFRSFMIATLLANDVFASSASASKLFLVANSVAMSVCSCFTISCRQEVLREESRIAYKIPILAGNGPPQSIYGSFWQSKKYSIFLKHPTFFLFSRTKMVFCYQNCSDLLWEKIVQVIKKNFWNSRLKAENLQNFWDH